ncbi:hypothetical protein SDC9_204055 [bioreactor metagenome]|uniref:Uncharacterized protein n=1 Tax=bioreactor metagenome TaxID=1076179 RepID=A0A645IYX4_9ZZZZ
MPPRPGGKSGKQDVSGAKHKSTASEQTGKLLKSGVAAPIGLMIAGNRIQRFFQFGKQSGGKHQLVVTGVGQVSGKDHEFRVPGVDLGHRFRQLSGIGVALHHMDVGKPGEFQFAGGNGKPTQKQQQGYTETHSFTFPPNFNS